MLESVCEKVFECMFGKFKCLCNNACKNACKHVTMYGFCKYVCNFVCANMWVSMNV